MYVANRFVMEDTPQSRQLRAGFPWLTLDGELEAEFRRTHLEENLRHIRVNLCLGLVMTLAFTVVDTAGSHCMDPSLGAANFRAAGEAEE